MVIFSCSVLFFTFSVLITWFNGFTSCLIVEMNRVLSVSGTAFYQCMCVLFMHVQLSDLVHSVAMQLEGRCDPATTGTLITTPAE